jgi:hypothetical protein
MIYHIRKDKVTVIDSRQVKVIGEIDMAKGESFAGIPEKAEFLVWSKDGVQVWDALTAEKSQRKPEASEVRDAVAKSLVRSTLFDKDEMTQLLLTTNLGVGDREASAIRVQ